MTSKVLYKFKSSKGKIQYALPVAKKFSAEIAVDFDVIKFDGVQIRLFDLKRRIVERKGFDKESEDFELVVINENTKEQYTDENAFIPKNSDLIVQRVPTTQRMGLLTRMKRSVSRHSISLPTYTNFMMLARVVATSQAHLRPNKGSPTHLRR